MILTEGKFDKYIMPGCVCICFLLSIFSIIIGFYFDHGANTPKNHEHNLEVLANLLGLTADKDIGCPAELKHTLHPFWFSNISLSWLGSLYGKLSNRVGEIAIAIRQAPNYDGDRNITGYTFTGYTLLAIFPLKYDFKSSTILCYDKERILPIMQKSYQGFQKTTLESIEFENIFDVYTTNPQEARLVLPPDVMQVLIDKISTRLLSNFSISFANGFLCVLLPHLKRLDDTQAYLQLKFLTEIPQLFDFKNFPYEWENDTLYRKRQEQDQENDFDSQLHPRSKVQNILDE